LNKARGRVIDSKLMTLNEAISHCVEDGDIIGLGGLSFWRKPIAAVREIIRQSKKDMTICTFVGGLEVDMLIAAGCLGWLPIIEKPLKKVKLKCLRNLRLQLP
jgi:hypothetical protein